MIERSTRLDPLEFRLYRRLKSYRGERWLLAVSGGRDSVAAAHVLRHLAPRLNLTLAMTYVHHGPSPDPVLQQARDRAGALVANLAQEWQVEWRAAGYSAEGKGPVPEGASEDALRGFRRSELERVRRDIGFDRVILAHHRDDLLETRLLRLIRGTGAEGLVAMRLEAGIWVRPFLEISRQDFADYAVRKQLRWQEDPSNNSHEPLRNWVRGFWLPKLEEKRAGAIESLMRSLELLVAQFEADGTSSYRQLVEACLKKDGIDRLLFDQLNLQDQHYVLALYLRRFETRGLGRSHIAEIAKRLDTVQKSHTFIVAQFNWVANAEQIRAEFIGNLDSKKMRNGNGGSGKSEIDETEGDEASEP